jgi:hypothetical protein
MKTYPTATYVQAENSTGKISMAIPSARPVVIVKTEVSFPIGAFGGAIAGAMVSAFLPFQVAGKVAFITACALLGTQTQPLVLRTEGIRVYPPSPAATSIATDHESSYIKCEEVYEDSTSSSSYTSCVMDPESTVLSTKSLEAPPPTVPKSQEVPTTFTKPLEEPLQKTNTRYVQYGVAALGIAGALGVSAFVAKTMFCAAAESVGISPSTLLTTTALVTLIGTGVVRCYKA